MLANEQDLLLPHTISEHACCPEQHRIGQIRVGTKAVPFDAPKRRTRSTFSLLIRVSGLIVQLSFPRK